MNNYNRIARKLREQMHRLCEGFGDVLSKPKMRFLGQMIYGIQAAKDVKLSNISRALEESISLKKTEERLSRHLEKPGLGQRVNEHIAGLAARRIHKDTLLIVDPSDIKKPYAKKMPYLARVRDGSAKEIVSGYWTCHIAACEPGNRRVIPLHQCLWSQKAPDFESENTQILRAIDTVRTASKDRGIWVMDRGGDRGNLLKPFLEREMRFIVRLLGNRNLVYKGHEVLAEKLARDCPKFYAERIVKEERGQEKSYHLEFGYRPVKLPGREEQLYLVVVTGFGQDPLMLITNLPMRKNRKVLWQVVKGYLSRWMIEETIRFIKQCYNLEDLRLLNYDRLRNMVAIVLAVVFFAAVHLGENIKLSVLTHHITKISKRFFGVPDFHYYALADGIANVLQRTFKGPLLDIPLSSPSDGQLTLFDFG